MVLFRSRNSARDEDIIPDISAPRLLRMTAIRNSMRVDHQYVGDKHGSLCGVQAGINGFIGETIGFFSIENVEISTETNVTGYLTFRVVTYARTRRNTNNNNMTGWRS